MRTFSPIQDVNRGYAVKVWVKPGRGVPSGLHECFAFSYYGR